MTAPATAPHVVADLVVHDTTSVLVRRDIRVKNKNVALSRFGDDTWDLSPAMADVHSAGQAIHWNIYPAAFREASKLYVFALVNVVDDAPRLASARSDVPAIKTIWSDLPFLRVFLAWLQERGLTSLDQVSSTDLDGYLWHTTDAVGRSTSWKRRALVAVQRLHAYRDFLPDFCRLPPTRPWGGAGAAELSTDPGPRLAENRTPRVHPDVMEPLLSAALLTITTIGEDLLPVARRLLAMRALAQDVAPDVRRGRVRDRDRGDTFRRQLDRLLPALRDNGHPLPSKSSHGKQVVDVVGLSIGGWLDRKLLAQRKVGERLLTEGLPLRRNHLRVTGFAKVNGQTWREEPVAAAELVALMRHVITAAFVVIGYLSGVRTGEALNLQRGCISRDRKLDLIYMSGLQMKSGDAGRQRSHATVPWVATEQVAQAIKLLESLTTGSLLFPSGEFCSAEWMEGTGRARTPGSINTDITRFIEWFNRDLAPAVNHPVVPADDHGRVTAPRLRRTLAWHIVRRPGGIVAGAVQYGHIRSQITQGYSGLADSGFVDELAFEELLVRIEALHEDAKRLEEGEHVSGPAAATYRERVAQAEHFAGLAINSRAQERQLLANPALNVHHGSMFTCVFRAELAACLGGAPTTGGPALDRCKVGCRNIALTDRDAEQLDQEIGQLELEMSDLDLPQPLRTRLGDRLLILRNRQREHCDSRAAATATPGGET
jgi:integrase